MTLNETFLPRLAEWQPPAGRHNLIAPDEGSGWAVVLTADRWDAMSCLIWEMTLRRTGVAAAHEPTALQAWADRIAERVTGLLEPLKVVEVDLLRNEALLRSDTPTRRADKLFYYEVHLRGTAEAVLRRYQGFRPPAGPRQQVAFALTHEVLAKVAADLTADD